jgi:hypothetical protein
MSSRLWRREMEYELKRSALDCKAYKMTDGYYLTN